MNDLYVYYQVRDEDAAAMASRVRMMQAGLFADSGVAGQLKRRPQASDGLQTWMEIYADTHAGFDAALGAAVQRAALAELTAGIRHTEIFTDLPTCA